MAALAASLVALAGALVAFYGSQPGQHAQRASVLSVVLFVASFVVYVLLS